MSTMAGAGSRSRDFHEVEAKETEQVYLLTRRRSYFPPPPASSPRAPAESAPFEITDWSDRRTSVPPEDGWGETVDDVVVDDDEDVSEIRLVRRFTRRRRATRVLGVLAVLGALAGGTFVLQQPKVRREALSFVTMGHEDAAARLGRRIASVVETLRGR